MYQHTSRRPDGQETLADEVGNVRQFDTNQCPHCGGHFRMVAGSGKRRAFCYGCNRITCGNPVCDTCVPTEALLDHLSGETTKYDDAIFALYGV